MKNLFIFSKTINEEMDKVMLIDPNDEIYIYYEAVMEEKRNFQKFNSIKEIPENIWNEMTNSDMEVRNLEIKENNRQLKEEL